MSLDHLKDLDLESFIEGVNDLSKEAFNHYAIYEEDEDAEDLSKRFIIFWTDGTAPTVTGYDTEEEVKKALLKADDHGFLITEDDMHLIIDTQK